jgi:hypothetical protein
MPDNLVDKVREFRSTVTNLKIYRAKGFCEICHRPYGILSPKLKGHHIVKPTLITDGTDPNRSSNIVICDDYCYNNKVINGSNKEKEIWINRLNSFKPKHTADQILNRDTNLKQVTILVDNSIHSLLNEKRINILFTPEEIEIILRRCNKNKKSPLVYIHELLSKELIRKIKVKVDVKEV